MDPDAEPLQRTAGVELVDSWGIVITRLPATFAPPCAVTFQSPAHDAALTTRIRVLDGDGALLADIPRRVAP